jgi:hypothetical protein
MVRTLQGCRLQDLNPQPTDYKSVALPIELSRHRRDKWWLGTESNRRHKDFQSFALPTELPSQISHRKQIYVKLDVSETKQANIRLWWRMTGSNRRPLACKASALPAELILPINLPSDDLLLQGRWPQLPSALESLTSVFGMGTGVSSPP